VISYAKYTIFNKIENNCCDSLSPHPSQSE